ncbi:MAG: BamA/TamA family outer membrane protein [Verrucomicrobia bacterium]|nr:BamA/TamA family outer membrane protein [Cytophagales bacterium]
MLFKYLLTFVLLISFGKLLAQTDTLFKVKRPLNSRIDSLLVKNERTEKKQGIFVMPILYYTPDTRFGFGAFGVFYFKLKNKKTQTETRLSYAKLLADYTLNRQLDIWNSWNIFLKDEKYLTKGELRYRIFPDRFYGIGNNTDEADVEKYQYNLVSIKMLLLRKLKKNVFIGGDYQLSYVHKIQTQNEGQLNTGNITGGNGGLNSGFGAVFLIDSRDNVVNATKGLLFEVSSYFYGKALGSDFTFNNYNITFNQYFMIKRFTGHVLAFNTVANFNNGNPPFLNLATVGGDEILRGYAKNRYRDMNFVGGQAEYRLPLWWRFGLVGFVGLGDVFRSTADLSFQKLKYSYGGGLRFMVNKKERLNIRFDYGFGKQSNSFYLSITEAF